MSNESEAGVEVRKCCCYFCHNNCGVLAYVKDGELLRFEGDPDHPASSGGLCCRGNLQLQHLHHPDRVNHPLKRIGPKGSGQWESISWEQAIDEIGAKLEQIRAESGAEAVATAGGTLRTDDWARRRFMNAFGSPNSFHNAHLCWIPTFMVEMTVYGWCPFEIDVGQARCIVLWGQNPGASSMPAQAGFTNLQRENGLKVIVIDPRYTESAAKADLWLPIRPGSDLALALAWINVIITEKLHNADFVKNYCEGFKELRKHVKDFTPEWAAELTWLDPEQIRAGARMYAANTPGNIQWAPAVDQQGPPAGECMHARAILRALTGNLDGPGADILTGPAQDYLTDEEMEANDLLPEEQKGKQLGADKYKLTTWPGYTLIAEQSKKFWGKAPTAEWMCEAHPPSVYRAILSGKPYQVRALLVSATNPVNSYGNSREVLAALEKVEFMTCCDYFLTPTAMLADYVLPIAGSMERPSVHTNYGVSDALVASQRAIAPLYQRKTDFDFWRLLGLRLGQAEHWPWETLEDAYFYQIANLAENFYGSESYDAFVEWPRFHYPEREFNRYLEHGFGTPSGKVELKSSILEQLGYPPLPVYVPPAESETANPELAEEFPLVLTTAGGFMPYHHSEHFNLPSVRFLAHEPYTDINPRTAGHYGIKNGDWVWIETRRGRIRQKANLTEAVMPRVVMTQRGWWFPERDMRLPELGGCLESNANVLTSTEDAHCDPLGGSWANRGLLCRIYKAE
ncbi:MAG: molybdopterin-dependent oxidoreductase [Gracilibacteraceae bacterium]|jgi:anaerobic selenocysteine-containing dehydrogenase|nr:molybdopterin-dependent oxidoreductase [Gracilibacteraceae bacterium]